MELSVTAMKRGNLGQGKPSFCPQKCFSLQDDKRPVLKWRFYELHVVPLKHQPVLPHEDPPPLTLSPSLE